MWNHVDQTQYDHIGDTIPDSRANFSRDDWMRQSKKFGIKEGKIAPKPKEALKGYTTHKVLEDEDDSPGFGILASLLAFTFVVYGRRKD